MIIRSDGMNYFIITIEFVFSFIISFLIFVESSKELLIYSSFCIIIINLIIICEYISICKTLIFSKDGIEITCLWIKKFYKWDELKFKRRESYKRFNNNYSNRYTEKPPYVRCVKFYKKTIKRSKYKNPDSFFSMFHPISFIYVNFLDDSVTEEDLRKCYPTKFTYNEKEFMDNMKNGE